MRIFLPLVGMLPRTEVGIDESGRRGGRFGLEALSLGLRGASCINARTCSCPRSVSQWCRYHFAHNVPSEEGRPPLGGQNQAGAHAKLLRTNSEKTSLIALPAFL